MTHIPDGAPCRYLSRSPKVIAIGWLDQAHAYTRGDCPTPFIARLADMLMEPWQWVAAAGWHDCNLCPPKTTRKGLPVEIVLVDGIERTIPIGIANLYVPGADLVYTAPSMIIHYINAHGYRPPDEYIEAVMACPPQDSHEFLEQLRRIAPQIFERGGD